MNIKNNNSVNNLIAKYLAGNASREEIQMLEDWFCESGENQAYFKQMKNIWEVSDELPISSEKALANVLNRIENGHRKISFRDFWQRAAGILIIPLLGTVLWLSLDKSSEFINTNDQFNKVVAAFGTFSSMELPDGSKVWLNAGSSLKYPLKFSKSNRSVYLTGEAYFEVKSDAKSPFLVNTSSFVVKATGTHFNVMAYKNSPAPSVTLLEGKVAVQKVNSGKKNKMISILRPNQHLIYDTLSENAIIQTEDAYKHIAWKDGKLVFRNDLLSDVAIRISLQYNVDVEIVGDQIRQYRYRATFENDPLNELLRLLKISSPIDYREVKPVALPDGSFSRKRIIIFPG
jgi:ferric-dicitrate binding protein FerR (iron transport regulator)